MSAVASRNASCPMTTPNPTPLEIRKFKAHPPQSCVSEAPSAKATSTQTGESRGKPHGCVKSTGIFQIVLNLCMKSVTREQSDLGSLELNPPLILLSKAGLQHSELRNFSSWMRASIWEFNVFRLSCGHPVPQQCPQQGTGPAPLLSPPALPHFPRGLLKLMGLLGECGTTQTGVVKFWMS